MKLNLNMTNIGGLFEPVPDDLYRVRIGSFDDFEGDKGPYVNCHMMIVDGEFAETRELSDNWFFGEKSLWRTKPILEVFSGVTWDKEDMDFDSDEFIGLEAIVRTKQESYPKKDGSGDGIKSKVVEYFPAPDNDFQENI